MSEDWVLEGTGVDKIPTEDKLILSYEEDLWEVPPIEYRDLSITDKTLLALDIYDMIPPEQLSEEVQEAILEAIDETERRLYGPRS